MKLEDIEADDLALKSKRAASSLAARLANHQSRHMVSALVRYAQRGDLPPDGLESVADLLLQAEDLMHHLNAPGHRADVCDALTLVFVAAAARLAIDRDGTVGHEGLAALAGLSRKGLWQASQRGDAPKPMADGRHRVYDPDECRTWLTGRGVTGFAEVEDDGKPWGDLDACDP
ncbi:MAG: hypothetical protein AAF715_28725 [Myxococcota bacterium]